MKYIKIESIGEGLLPFTGKVITSRMGEKKGRNLNIQKQIGKMKREGIEGIALNGDWDSRPLELLEVLEELQDGKLNVLITTPWEFDTFKMKVGIASYEKYHGKMDMMDDTDEPILIVMGGMLVDYYLRNTDYYIRSMEKGVPTEIFVTKSDKGELEDGEEIVIG